MPRRAMVRLAVAAVMSVSAAQPPPRLESFSRSIGPLKLSGQSFTVTLEMKRVQGPGPIDRDFQETVTGMVIRDAAGKSHYQKSFPHEVSGNRFAETISVEARVLELRKGAALLFTYGVAPSTPLGGQSWQVFAVRGGKLAPLSKPFSTEGGLLGNSWDSALQADVFEFRVWTGNFFVIVPLRLDWLGGRIMPAWRCWKMTARGPLPRCQLRVQAERRPGDDLTFVRLFPDTGESTGVPEHAVVKKDSRVEFLAAEAELRWEERGEQIGLGVSEDVWLKVRVDGKEGWIHKEEDFRAVGLPAAG